jgi:lipopolysaccharide/colanic/teichoic acid biosynthesis glycosyltransferase
MRIRIKFKISSVTAVSGWELPVSGLTKGLCGKGLKDSEMRHTHQPTAFSGANRSQQMRHSGEFLTVCILLVFTLPLMVIIAVMMKCESASGPVFERRQRIGPDGRRFQVLNFRTAAYRPGQRGTNWQMTPLGQFLKNTRLDALPQLLSVLRGHIGLTDTAFFD